ncbi:MAG TPA: amino acid--tRNA ligase-related protein, partial [Actinomycetota bacterium]|nr:amino acid--tRNA ligase-related protein [Actinomycetota bacterium]
MADEPSPGVPPGDGAGTRSREADILMARRGSMSRLNAAGMPPFALSLETALGVAEPAPTADVRARHADLAADRVTDEVVTIAGRVVFMRDIGKLKFYVVRDRSGDLQVVATETDLDDGPFGLLGEVDLGDIIGVTGRVGTTRKGELSVFADRWAMLTKALRPLPEKWHGLQDPDLQQRRRYLHLIADDAPRRAFLARAAVLKTMRQVLDERGFIEFEGPMLQTVAGGANARPFETHHHALDMPMKLRISLELYLKRMLVGGVERVYELGRNFRNEGIDRDHNPEFSMLEAYQAWGDYHTMMELSEALIVRCARAVNPIMGREADDLRVSVRGREVDLTPPFARVTVLGSVSEAVGEPITLDHRDLRGVAERHGVQVDA